MAHHKPSCSHHSSTPVDIVTYRYNGALMYVPVGETYSEALNHARDAFPQLKNMKDVSITLSFNVVTGTPRKLVGITPSAWPRIISHLTRFEVIDVQVATIPNITITVADDSEPAPPYPLKGWGCMDIGLLEDKSHPDVRASRHRADGVSSSSLTPPPSPGRLSPKWILSKLGGS